MKTTFGWALASTGANTTREEQPQEAHGVQGQGSDLVSDGVNHFGDATGTRRIATS